MRPMLSLLTLIMVPGVAAAHVANLPMPQHALEHAWQVLLIVPLLAILLPLGSSGR